MTDFKGINPDKHLGTSFNTNRQGKGTQPDAPGEKQEAAPATDRYADQKVDPNHMLKLLEAQAKMNVPIEVENPGITSAVSKFTTAISPERHARVSRIIEQAYTKEFGTAPNPELLQDIIDDYLIGRGTVQNS